MTSINSAIPAQGVFKADDVKLAKTEYNNSDIPNIGLEQDTVDIKKEKTGEAPEIGALRLAFGFLTDEQVAQINNTGKLPPNAKFVPNGMGGYTITNNFFGIIPGTQELPVGFEVKKDVLGFTAVLPKGTNSVLIRDKKEV